MTTDDEESSHDPHWHPRATAFILACLVVVLAFLALLLVASRAPKAAANYADILIALAGLFIGILGVRGETWNARSPHWFQPLTYAGLMMITALIFGFGVGIYQKFWIQEAVEELRERESNAEKQGLRNSLDEAKSQIASTNSKLTEADTKLTSTNSQLTEARKEVAKLSTLTDSLRAKLSEIEGGLAQCPKSVRDGFGDLRELLDSGNAALWTGLFLEFDTVNDRLSAIQNKMASEDTIETLTRNASLDTQQALRITIDERVEPRLRVIEEQLKALSPAAPTLPVTPDPVVTGADDAGEFSQLSRDQ